ncbi:ACP phosphodiesterase [Pseudoalteromonas obscura]|uniref:ACP phosphodiesterase n=1 Tax=Pseudoalteromonas obscura TaxID=3048491 RepID=A0ABT7EF13_9GAMM|nr:ACP phosphodiesterase [Pseudoalteromonas sp. P94(2023)]MDK2593876.1 ACP phosphodiesterase [Pseudoalteromonas sp. P94(2023)]
MNYLAHLYLAKKNADSYYGNLLGDFQRGIDTRSLPATIQNGLANHILVDKFTDQHKLVKQSQTMFSAKRRRFSGIALDVFYDHLLIKNWSAFSTTPFEAFKTQSYNLLRQHLPSMHQPMQQVVEKLITGDWFSHYQTLDGTTQAIDNIANRIRFKNEFKGVGKELTQHYCELEQLFLMYFPELINHVADHSPENQN